MSSAIKHMTKAFERFELLNEKELEDIEALAILRTLEKGDYFLKAGNSVSEIAFIHSGMLRSHLVTSEGIDHTYCVSFEGDFITAYSDYISGTTTIQNIQAMVPTELIILKKEDVEKRANEHLPYTKLMRFFAERYIVELEQRVFSHQTSSAKERYANMFLNHPKYIHDIPLHHLATYLGITQRHLSRIRKEISI